jgi:hypothetical protein
LGFDDSSDQTNSLALAQALSPDRVAASVSPRVRKRPPACYCSLDCAPGSRDVITNSCEHRCQSLPLIGSIFAHVGDDP